MIYDIVVGNPPFSRSLHLEIISKVLPFMSKGSFIHPSTWLINVRKNGKAKMYDDLKKKLGGHIKSIEVENYNKEFNITIDKPLVITTIDKTRVYDDIDFTCCGEHKTVNSLYDCNLIGDYRTIWSILDKVHTYGDMMKDHTTETDMGEDYWYIQYNEIVGTAIGNHNIDVSLAYMWDSLYDKTTNGEYYNQYTKVAFNINVEVEICSSMPKRRLAGGGKSKVIRYSDKYADCIYGTKQELENWKHFIYNNKLPLFINIVLTIDHNNNSKEFLPWLVDKQYTDDEINELFGFTEDEIRLIDGTLKKFERHSPWFKRYMCGK